ncbi:hypothetical protein ERJ75_000056100 [Trypanosoma vivax]|nr:hypothetical protein ERJ75_000056100 [Trypanosoma vivax]
MLRQTARKDNNFRAYGCHWGCGPRRATRLQRKSKVGTSTPGKGTPHALPNALVKSEAARRSAGQPPEFSESEGAPAWKGGRHPGKSPCKWASGRPQSSGQFPPSGRDMAKAAGRSRGLFAKAPPESRRSARTWLFSGARGKWANGQMSEGLGELVGQPRFLQRLLPLRRARKLKEALGTRHASAKRHSRFKEARGRATETDGSKSRVASAGKGFLTSTRPNRQIRATDNSGRGTPSRELQQNLAPSWGGKPENPRPAPTFHPKRRESAVKTSRRRRPRQQKGRA